MAEPTFYLTPPPFRETLVYRGPLTLTEPWQRWLALFWQQAGAGGEAGTARPRGASRASGATGRAGRRGAAGASRRHWSARPPGHPGHSRAAWLCPHRARSVPTVNGASVLTATALVPTGARIVAVLARIDTTFSAANGLTAIQVGDCYAGRWLGADRPRALA